MRKITWTLLLLTVTALPAWCDKAEDFVNRMHQFDQAVMSAQKFEDLYPILTKNTVTELKTWTDEQRVRGLKLMKMGVAMGGGSNLKVKESKIGSHQASITLEAKTTQGKATRTTRREANFRKESGAWKTDLGDSLEKMKR